LSVVERVEGKSFLILPILSSVFLINSISVRDGLRHYSTDRAKSANLLSISKILEKECNK
jgi:hypothetical protein